MYGQKNENDKIINSISVEVEGFDKLPEGAHVGDYVKDGKAYTPPNGYSILTEIQNGNPVWVEDTEAKNAEADNRRRAAYTAESDALFFKEQRGEIPAGAWAAKVAEIKKRFPKV